jgi:hypothetical protein
MVDPMQKPHPLACKEAWEGGHFYTVYSLVSLL